MKQRFLEHGDRIFDDYQLLELLLYYAVPRRDTNPLAHELMERFGSLSGVLEAGPEELRQLSWVSDSVVVLFELLPQLMRRYQESAANPDGRISSVEDAAAYLRPYFFGLRKERAYLLSVSAKGRVLGCDFLGGGTDTSVGIDPRQLVEIALRHHAAWVVLAHSHPSGIAMPSGADIQVTRACRQVLRPLRIELRDHLIFADDDYVSLRDSNLMD